VEVVPGTAVLPVPVTGAPAAGAMSSESRQELSTFISNSVLPQTIHVYNKNFAPWQEFVKVETGSDDPFLTEVTDSDRVSLASLMILRRHQNGKRGKAATAITAAIRLTFLERCCRPPSWTPRSSPRLGRHA
jgi:hypothetical protein